MFRRIHLCAVFALSLSAFPAAAAVFGRDNRGPLPVSRAAIAEKIGTLVAPKTGALCTAFCVAPDMIATASHCFFGTAAGGAPDLAGLRFKLASEPSSPGTAIAGAATANQSQNIVSGTRSLNVAPPIGADRDWAVARLETPACHAGGLALSNASTGDVRATAARGGVYQIAMHRDLPDTELRVAEGCALHTSFAQASANALAHDFANPAALLLHTCDTGPGSSGSPMLVDGASGPEVVGINVGTYVISRSIISAVSSPATPDSEPISNTALVTTQFANAIGELSRRVLIDKAGKSVRGRQPQSISFRPASAD